MEWMFDIYLIDIGNNQDFILTKMIYKSLFTNQSGFKLKQTLHNYSVIASVLEKANVGEVTEVKVCIYRNNI